ncbi:MAG: hypothetical protein CLLPBCKN_003256 [Chroococcidiopsis cubana SAG 39.79]|nr:hypothetical protein [Chroococcidiopsis cubana]MDZ4873860.1 hypothetical protein [Chroococcidiopsis cubana SAG 39.79]
MTLEMAIAIPVLVVIVLFHFETRQPSSLSSVEICFCIFLSFEGG